MLHNVIGLNDFRFLQSWCVTNGRMMTIDQHVCMKESMSNVCVIHYHNGVQFQIISSRDKGESFAETEKKDFISASVNNNDQSKTIPDKKHI